MRRLAVALVVVALIAADFGAHYFGFTRAAIGHFSDLMVIGFAWGGSVLLFGDDE